MRNIFLVSVLTITGLLCLCLSTAAQRPGEECVGVPGQVSCKPVGNGCIQNAKYETLFPASPYQTLKQYHGDRPTQPNPLLTPADSWDCKVASRGVRRFCLATYLYHNQRMSNVYIADTGQVVRCFWDAKYRQDQENMGTLLAKGTTIYPGFTIMNGVRLATMIEGGTYPVNKREFDCCQPMSDAEQAQLSSAATKNGELFINYRLNGMLYMRIR